MMTGKYHLPRQRHLGDLLDWLEVQGHLSWTWDYDGERRRAGYVVAHAGSTSRLDTKQTEQLVQRLTADLGLVWEPAGVPAGRRKSRGLSV